MRPIWSRSIYKLPSPSPTISRSTRSQYRIPTIHHHIGSGHERGGVGGEEDAEAVELIDVAQAVLGSERAPDLLLGVKGRNAVEGSVHVTGRNAVDTDAVLGPLSTNGLGELNDTGLGGVVAGLLLGVVDDGTGHGGDQDQATGLASGHHGATDSLGHEEGTSQIDVNETTEHGGVVGLGLDVGVGDTGGVDEGVGGTIEFDNGVDSSVDGGTITDIDFEERDGKTRLLVQLGGSLVTELLVGVENDNVLGTGLGAGASHVVTETTSTTSDNDGLAVNGHALHCVGEGLVGLLADGVDSVVISRGSRAVVGNASGALGDVEGRLVTLAGAIVDCDGNLLLADDALLVGGVLDTVDACGREEADGVVRGGQSSGGSSSSGSSQDVACRERHCERGGVCVLVLVVGVGRR